MTPHEFQVLLAEALIHLRETRDVATQEKRDLVLRKSALSPDWFKSRMRAIGHYCSVLDRATSVLTSIGDAFVWLFYMKKPDLLWQHLQKPRQHVSTGGVGGLGELTFIRGVPHMSGMPVLSHLVTTMLRIGDVTLVDPGTGEVAALGELKIARRGEFELSIRLEVVGAGAALGKRLKADAPQHPVAADPIWPGLLPKLQRQVSEMQRLFSSSASTAHEDMRGAYYTDELRRLGEELATKRVAYVQAGPNLLLVGIRNSARRSLYSRLQGGLPAGFERETVDLPTHILGILDPQSALNSIQYGTLDGTYFPGGTPLFWWPVGRGLVEDIYLGRVVVVSLYNPIGLISQLLADGFLSDDPAARLPRFHLETDEGAEIALENFGFWISAIRCHLVREETVLSAIRKATRTLIDSKPTGTTRMEIAFNQYLFGPH